MGTRWRPLQKGGQAVTICGWERQFLHEEKGTRWRSERRVTGYREAWIDRTGKWDRTSRGDLNALLLAVDYGNTMQLDGHQGGDQKAELSAVDRGGIAGGGGGGRTYESVFPGCIV